MIRGRERTGRIACPPPNGRRFLHGALVVLLLGTGYPRPDPAHAGPSTAVIFGDKWFVVDAGRGATLRIAGTDLKYANLQAVFLTHLHSDHTAGLPDLFSTSWQFGRKTRPLALYGPPGTAKLSKGMLDFFAEDIHIRRDLQEKHPAIGATIRTTIVRDGAVVYDDGEVKVTAFAVDHKPVEHAFGYRFEAGGQTVVISGDTRPTPNLIRYAKGADVLVLEAYLPEHFDKVDTPEVAARLKRYHTSAEEAGEIAEQSGVKTLVLTHLIPANAEETFRERAARKFKGTIVVGRDLLRIPDAAPKPEPLAIGESFTIDSAILGERRRINVYVPPSPDVNLPVLYMPDWCRCSPGTDRCGRPSS